MAAPLAEPADVEAIWRPLESAETIQATQLINIASAKLRAAVPFDIDARMAVYGANPPVPLALDPVVVANVVATIVKRVLVNPDGLASTTQTFGPISEQRTFQGRNSSSDEDTRGEVVILASDIGNLLPTARTRSKLRSVPVGLTPMMQPPSGIGGYPGLYPNGWDVPEWPGGAL